MGKMDLLKMVGKGLYTVSKEIGKEAIKTAALNVATEQATNIMNNAVNSVTNTSNNTEINIESSSLNDDSTVVQEVPKIQVINDATIADIIHSYLTSQSGCGILPENQTEAEKKKMLLQITGCDTYKIEDIIGLYDASIANSLTGNFLGILFLSDRIYVKVKKDVKTQYMLYSDIKMIKRVSSKLILTSNSGEMIALGGIMYASEDIEKLLKNIVGNMKG